MFEHVVERGGKFYIRRWSLGFELWSIRGAWWHYFQDNATAFDTREDAVSAYRSHKSKFRGFL